MVIKGKKVILRPIRLEDARRFVGWVNDQETGKLLRGHNKKITLKEERAWIRGLRKKIKTEKQFAIDASDGTHIGSAGLFLSPSDNNAKFGVLIGDKRYWNKGYGSETMTLILDFAFHDLHLHKVEADIFAYNKRSAHVCKKLGFKIEGTKKDHIRYKGKYYDEIQVGLFKGWWAKRRK